MLDRLTFVALVNLSNMSAIHFVFSDKMNILSSIVKQFQSKMDFDACEKGDYQRVLKCLQNGADVNELLFS